MITVIHHTVPTLEEHQYDAAAVHVGINDFLKGIPNNVAVDGICDDILKLHYVAVIMISVRCLFQVLPIVPK